MVAERDDVLNLPENAARMTVLVVAQGDIPDSRAGFKKTFEVFEEPRFGPQTDVHFFG